MKLIPTAEVSPISFSKKNASLISATSGHVKLQQQQYNLPRTPLKINGFNPV